MITVDIVDYTTHRTNLHAIRSTVFVDEQKVPPELEVDDLDPHCIHVLARVEGHCVGTGRLTPSGHIGRVAVKRSWRRQGIGRQVMERLLAVATQQGYPKVIISAQCHAIAFYHKFGFVEEGDVYLEAGIKHIKMVKALAS